MSRRAVIGRGGVGRAVVGMFVALGRVALGRVALGRVALGRVALGRVALGRVALGMSVALAACSVLPSPEPPHYEYVVLTTAPAASPPAGASAAVAIDRIRLPAYLERAELVTRVSDNRLEFSPRARWAEPLQVAVPRVLAEALAAAAVRVVERGDPATERTIDLAIDQLERTASGARLRARWWLSQARRPAGANQLTADEPLPPGASSDAVAAALSRLLVRLGAAIAADVRG